MSASQGSTPRILWAIVALALGLRLWGISFGLYHADEPIIVHHALAYGIGDLNPHFFTIPPLVSYLVFFVYGLFYVLGVAAGIFTDLGSFQNLFIENPEVFYVIARFFAGVLPGVGTVIFVWKMTRRFWGESAAAWATLAMAVNFLHVRNSHYVYADILMTLSVLVTVYVSLRLLEKNDFLAYAICGITAGVSTAFKYNAAVVALVPMLAFALKKTKDASAFILSVILGAATFVVLNPYAVLDWRTFVSDIWDQTKAESALGLWHHINYSLAGSCGWGVLLIAVAGFWLMITRNKHGAAIFGLFPLVFLLKLSVFSQPYERYVMPIIPFVSIGFGVGVAGFTGPRPLWVKRYLVLAVAGLALLYPLTKSLMADALLAEPDTRQTAKAWIENHIPNDTKVLFSHSFYRPRLVRSLNQWNEFEPSPSEDTEAVLLKNELVRRSARNAAKSYYLYFLSDQTDHKFTSVRPLVPYDWQKIADEGIQVWVHYYGVSPEHEAFYEKIPKEARLLKRFSPYRSDRLRSYDRNSLTAAAYSLKELKSRKRFGPVIEVYAL